MDKKYEDIFASQEILDTNIKLFHEGKREVYRVIAVQLRLLLTDNSLLLRVFKNAKLHPLFINIWEDEVLKEILGEATVLLPGFAQFNGDGTFEIYKLFNEKLEPIDIEKWLDQNLFNKDINIREIIRSVADKQGAHSDPTFNETLLVLKGISYITEECYKSIIVAIGEYVLKMIKKWM